VREAQEYDEAAVAKAGAGAHAGCPGRAARAIKTASTGEITLHGVPSRLMQWPCQIKLVPPNAPYFDHAELLIAADCTAFAYGNIHADFINGRITLIGCPKLDAVDYAEKLLTIIKANAIKGITVLRMEVPCCGGLENAVKRAIRESGKDVPLEVVTVSTDGRIL
jgi:hypothetical protein